MEQPSLTSWQLIKELDVQMIASFPGRLSRTHTIALATPTQTNATLDATSASVVQLPFSLSTPHLSQHHRVSAHRCPQRHQQNQLAHKLQTLLTPLPPQSRSYHLLATGGRDGHVHIWKIKPGIEDSDNEGME
jgi:hypothetical protein